MTITRYYIGIRPGKVWLATRTTEPFNEASADSILDIVEAYGLPGATIYTAYGLWEGQRESTYVVELWFHTPSPRLAEKFRAAFGQDQVAWTSQEVQDGSVNI